MESFDVIINPPKITVLGCSGSYAKKGGACTGFLVQSPEANVWLDAGPGTLGNLQKHIEISDLTAIVLTHEHADHWLELPVVYNAIRHYVMCGQIPVYGTQGTMKLAKQMCPVLEEAFNWNVIKDGSREVIGDQSWRWSQTDHYVETVASRVEVGESSFVFTADTGPNWDVSTLGESVSLAISESTFLACKEDEGILHLSARQAAELAKKIKADHLVLSHLAPGEDRVQHEKQASEVFDGPITVATAGDQYSF